MNKISKLNIVITYHYYLILLLLQIIHGVRLKTLEEEELSLQELQASNVGARRKRRRRNANAMRPLRISLVYNDSVYG